MKVTNCLTTHYVDTEALDRDNITADERPDTIIMGATGWSYFVPYEANIATALERLRQDGFTRGDYVFGVGLSAKLDSVPTDRTPGVALKAARVKTHKICPRWANRVVMLAGPMISGT
jgi:hypothetical protein